MTSLSEKFYGRDVMSEDETRERLTEAADLLRDVAFNSPVRNGKANDFLNMSQEIRFWAELGDLRRSHDDYETLGGEADD